MALDENGGIGATMLVGPTGVGNYGGGYPMAYPVMPFYGGFGGGYGGGGYGFGGDIGWLVLIILLAGLGGGWGNGFGGGFGNDGAFPWLLNGQAGINSNISSSFDNAAVGSQLSAIQASLNSADVANCNRAMDAMQTAYTNEIADLNRSFAAQTAVDNRLDTLSSQLQQCCCDNELRTEQLRFTVATENAADREALSNGIRDILTAQTAGTQRILDQLCNDKIDAKNERIAELQTQVNMQNLAASQAAQTAALVADNNAQTATLINRIAPYPQPSFIVGNPYYSGYGYGCGNNWGGNWGNFGFGGFNPFGNVGFGNGSF